MTRQNILRVLHCVGHMKKAGAETFIMNVYRNIDRDKVQFDFLCCETIPGDYDEEIVSLGGNLFYLDTEKHAFPGKLIYAGRVLQYLEAFRKHPEVSIVHIHGHHAFDIYMIAAAAGLAGKKTIIHSHNAYAENHLTLHRMFKTFVSQKRYIKLACSGMAGKWMFKNDDFFVIPNGIDGKKFLFDEEKRKRLRAGLGIADRFVIGHVGRFEEQKNHRFLLKLFARYKKRDPDAVLLLIGEGILEREAKKFVEKNGLCADVRFLGVKNNVNELYSAMDAFVFPSLYEGLGIVAVEAESSDLPCIFSHCLPDDIDITDKVIRCSLEEDEETWIRALEECKHMSQTAARRNMGDIIRRKGFDVRDSSRKLMEIYLSASSPSGVTGREGD